MLLVAPLIALPSANHWYLTPVVGTPSSSVTVAFNSLPTLASPLIVTLPAWLGCGVGDGFGVLLSVTAAVAELVGVS